MKNLNLYIDFGDNAKKSDAIKTVVNLIDRGCCSSFRGGATRDQQREIDETMRKIYEYDGDGNVQVKDTDWAKIVGWWLNRNLPAAWGQGRNQLEMIDMLMCPDDYPDTNNNGTPSKKTNKAHKKKQEQS